MRKLFLITCIISSNIFTNYKAQTSEDYPSLPGDYYNQWEDCGIDPGTLRGGQYSTEELNKMCEENKASTRKKIIIYSISGLLGLIIIFKLVKRGSKAINSGINHQKLAESFNAIYIMIQDLKEKTDIEKIKLELINISFITQIEICDSIDSEKKGLFETIIVPAISNNTISIQLAYKETVGEIYILAKEVHILDEVDEIFNKGPLFEKLKREFNHKN